MANANHRTPDTAHLLFQRACRVIPGGVNSPVRAFDAVGGDPLYVVRGNGARIRTVDGKELVDFCGSWGPLLFGHARQEIVAAIQLAAAEGTSFGINTPREVEMAERLCELIPSMEMVRLVSSGTEAVMTALRLARGFTGRRKILKFDGCYHGHSDAMLVAAGSGLLTGGISSSAGVPPSVAAEIFVASYNDLEAVKRIIQKDGSDLAAIIVEPIAGNMGVIPPAAGFLAGLREMTKECGALLIFDEVITGFRLGPKTYGAICGVTPDLTTLGKIIGGGMPIGAVGGRADILRQLAPLGPVYQAGTLSGNPVAVAAGLSMLDLIRAENPYPMLEMMGRRLSEGLQAAARETGIALRCTRMGGMLTPFFMHEVPTDLTTAKHCDTQAYAAFFREMRARGFYLPPSQFETAFISAAHSEEDIARFLAAAHETFKTLGTSQC